MHVLSIEEIQRYLDLAAEVGRSFPVIDVHVHGTETIFRQLAYGPSAHAGEIRSAVPTPACPTDSAPA